MKWKISKNNQIIDLNEMPVLDINELRDEIIRQYRTNKRVISFFGSNEVNRIKLYSVLANDINSELLISSSYIEEKGSYLSIT